MGTLPPSGHNRHPQGTARKHSPPPPSRKTLPATPRAQPKKQQTSLTPGNPNNLQSFPLLVPGIPRRHKLTRQTPAADMALLAPHRADSRILPGHSSHSTANILLSPFKQTRTLRTQSACSCHPVGTLLSPSWHNGHSLHAFVTLGTLLQALLPSGHS